MTRNSGRGDLYGALYRGALWPVWERALRRRPTLAILAELRRLEGASGEKLASLQRQALAALLRHAYESVPFYRRRFERAGVTPSDIARPRDLLALPPLTRDEARAHHDDRIARDPRPAIRKTTGGTTAEPLVIRYDRGSEYWRQAVKLRAFEWAGYRPGDRALHYWGEPTQPARGLGSRLKRALDGAARRERVVDCTPRGEAHLAAAARALRRHRPRALFCYAQAAVDLARYIDRAGVRDWPDMSVICGAEPLYPGDRDILTRAFGGPVYETYGCREFMLIASECEAQSGLHIAAENLIVEIITSRGGQERPAEPGEVGEVVITDLHNFGMPFIRYKTGDLAVAAASNLCACGRPHPRLTSVEGRIADALTDASGGRVGGMVVNLIASPIADAVRAFQAVQRPDRSIVFKVVPTDRFGGAEEAHIRRQFERYVPGVPVAIERVAEIPKSQTGKIRPVINEAAAGGAEHDDTPASADEPRAG